jgi:hypothetical protein
MRTWLARAAIAARAIGATSDRGVAAIVMAICPLPRAIVRAKGAHLICLPPYSPDLNPIEQVFAKLKHLVRKAQPRDLEATWRKVGQLLDRFTPAECANYLVNSGYGSV